MQVVPTISSVSTGATAQQSIPGGPVASMVPIEMIGDNGGGYFLRRQYGAPVPEPEPSRQRAHHLAGRGDSFRLPVGLRPAGRIHAPSDGGARCHGHPVRGCRWSRWPLWKPTATPISRSSASPSTATSTNPGGNLEGKDLRLGATGSALNAVTMTATSTGGVNSAMESYTPLGGGLSLADMMLGEVIPGGTGTGLYGMLIFVLITAFIAGLMVGTNADVPR